MVNLRMLLEHGAITAANDSEIPLSLACEQGSVEVVQAFIPKLIFNSTEKLAVHRYILVGGILSTHTHLYPY